MLLNTIEVKKILPHRSPFLFVDSIQKFIYPETAPKTLTDVKDLIGMTVVGEYFVDPKLEIFSGHFPGNPILPGVIQIEMMAQVACFSIYDLIKEKKNISLEVALLTVNQAKFRTPIKPGMHLIIETVTEKARSSMMTYNCRILCDNKICSEANLLALCKY
jgi:3-hydroxyacyl-[acyl-carrier-protein] dehydratase